ncbi:MAG TPA: S8 family serine peptidase [Egibacteraceae bacterium]|nr:S8 family serine peptidase [Egibacteraceae bacterium]
MRRGGWSRRRRAAAAALLAAVLVAASGAADPLIDRQYHLRRVRAPDAWSVTRGADQLIAVLDTGVDHRHPDLQGRVLRGIDLVDRGTRPVDRNGHGTFVAGVAVANLRNGEGGAGVAPQAMVLPVRVLDDEGMGTSDVVAEGIRWATRRGAHVINLSLADVPGQQRPPTALITTDVELAIRQAALNGIVVVVAAGNDGQDRTPYADDLPALVVGASNRRDQVWQHSNRDDRTLFAPGVNIISTYVGEPYAAADGTSFAAPIVSAAAAMLRQRGFDAQQTRRRLQQTARPIGAGRGRVDVAAALGIAPPVTETPSPRPSPRETASPQAQSRPRPVAPPSPVEPPPQRPRQPRQPRAQGQQEPPPPPEPTEQAPPEVAQAEPPPEAMEEPSPIPEPQVAPASEIAAPGDQPATDGRPLWPLALAGLLLFAVSVALGGYVTARRSPR